MTPQDRTALLAFGVGVLAGASMERLNAELKRRKAIVERLRVPIESLDRSRESLDVAVDDLHRLGVRIDDLNKRLKVNVGRALVHGAPSTSVADTPKVRPGGVLASAAAPSPDPAGALRSPAGSVGSSRAPGITADDVDRFIRQAESDSRVSYWMTDQHSETLTGALTWLHSLRDQIKAGR